MARKGKRVVKERDEGGEREEGAKGRTVSVCVLSSSSASSSSSSSVIPPTLRLMQELFLLVPNLSWSCSCSSTLR